MGRPEEAGFSLIPGPGGAPSRTSPPPPAGPGAAPRRSLPSRNLDGLGIPGDDEDGTGNNDDHNSQDNRAPSYTQLVGVRIHASPESVYQGEAGDDELGPPPGYTAARERDADTISLPPAYGDYAHGEPPLSPSLDTITEGPASPGVGGAAPAPATAVEPVSLIISGHFIYHDPEGLDAEAAAAALAGLPLYAMNRGIASLSHSDTGVDLERIDYTIRPADSNNQQVRITSRRPRSIFTLRHIDERSVNLYARPLKGFRNRAEGQGEPTENIPRFACQAASRRCLGSFGIRKVRHRVVPHHYQQQQSQAHPGQLGRRPSDNIINNNNDSSNAASSSSGGGGGGAGSKVTSFAAKINPLATTEQGYAVVRLARPRARDNVPYFAVGDKGTGFAKPFFEARRVVDSSGSNAFSRLGLGGGAKAKGKARANSTSASSPATGQGVEMEASEWDWLDEFGTCIAREDQVLRTPIPNSQGVLPELLATATPAPPSPPSPPPSSPSQQQQQQQQQHRLVTLSTLPREEFDVLVSSWCLRVWWANADSLSSSGGPGGGGAWEGSKSSLWLSLGVFIFTRGYDPPLVLIARLTHLQQCAEDSEQQRTLVLVQA